MAIQAVDSRPMRSETAKAGASSSVRMNRAKTTIVTRCRRRGPIAQLYLESSEKDLRPEWNEDSPIEFAFGDEFGDFDPLVFTSTDNLDTSGAYVIVYSELVDLLIEGSFVRDMNGCLAVSTHGQTLS